MNSTELKKEESSSPLSPLTLPGHYDIGDTALRDFLIFGGLKIVFPSLSVHGCNGDK
jgi:hypothetical protein